MTNNEAAKWIQLYIDLAKIDPTTGEEAYLNEDDRKTLEAMEMAIEALSSIEPKRTEKRTETRACDCISRQAVTDTVRKIILGFFSDEDGVMTDTEKTLLSVNKAICDGVRALPSAQQDCTDCEDYDSERHYCPRYCETIRRTVEEAKQERTGRWVRNFDGNEWYWFCSNCKEEWYEEDLLMGGNDFPNFCPNCGARMEGES